MLTPAVPLVAASSMTYAVVQDDTSLGSMIFELTLTNVSTELEVRDLTATIYVPAYDRLESMDHASSKGSKARVNFNAPTRTISIKLPKVKCNSTCQVEIFLKVRRPLCMPMVLPGMVLIVSCCVFV